ncbi:hypothetical protein B296_00010717 [Ensete ventricosum]|uniref:Uncharacterized protein n=1 Tax=Ensete ventricosum TaxID=4639 RepID=A0A426ZTR9_ENSVE|nr:hypothetical protein B296_00010717 [Ensete ventricosum]
MIWVLLISPPESDIRVVVTSRSLFDYGSRDNAVGNSPEMHQELTENIRSLSRVRQKLVEGDRELAKMTQGSSLEEDQETRQKIIEGSRKAYREFGRSEIGFVSHIDRK